ncbi:hypothetical protein [Paenibacillus humicola]|uniref:hypothetical protein n=1 Tax=Paenibacillus humicola TaxID=3110540 RepID=UPI00237B2125|nr:hypothetical protein [Paenibacillus humicola]
MPICFVEYRIDPDFEAEYRHWIGEKQAAPGGFELYEGTDQPFLFVEVWKAESVEAAERIKKERLRERSEWSRMAAWVQGGAPKIHAWTFRPVAPA